MTGDLKCEVTAFQFREGKEGQLQFVTLNFHTTFSKQHSRAWKATNSVAIQEIFWIIWIWIIAVFTRAHHLILSSARWILSMTLRPFYFGNRPTLYYLRLGHSNFPPPLRQLVHTSVSTCAKFRANLNLLDLTAWI